MICHGRMADVENVQRWKTRETQEEDGTRQFYGQALDGIINTVDFFKIYAQLLHSAVNGAPRIDDLAIQLFHFQADGAT